MGVTEKLKEVQSVIIALLTAERNNGIEIGELDGLYRDLESQRIPYRTFGCASLTEFLRGIPEIKIQSSSGEDLIYFAGKGSTEHVKRLVAKQRPPSKKISRSRSCSKQLPEHYYSQLRRSPPPQKYDRVSDNILDIIKENSRGLSRSVLRQRFSSRYPESIMDHNTLSRHLNILQNEIMVRDSLVFPVRNTRSVRSSTPRSHSVSGPHANYVCDRNFTKDTGAGGTIAKSCGESPNSDIPKTTASDFIEKSALQESGQNLKEEEPVVNSVIENNSEMQLEQRKKDEDDVVALESQDCMAALNARVRFRLEKLIQNNPDGIRCIDLPNKYREEYGVSLDWESLGFQRISNFAAHLPDIFHVVGPSADNEYVLYNAKEPLPTDRTKENRKQKLTDANIYASYDSNDEIEAVPSSISRGLSNQISPDDVMSIGESVGQISVTRYKVIDDVDKHPSLLEVRVVESFSPSFFWIHIEKNRRNFVKMMEELQAFYEDYRTKYMVPIIMLEKGLNVACMFFGKWHRAIIKAVDPQCQVTLLFYDYGTVKTYPADQIFYLQRKFSALPAQAIPCGLYNVRPIHGNKWPKNVIDWFIKRVHDRVMWMMIGKIDIETNSMVISLTDTSGEHDFHVGDKMFEKKMAIRGNMDIVDPEELCNYVEDYGEGPQVSDEPVTHQSEPLDNMLKLPAGTTPDTVENLCRALSILEKEQSVVITTKDTIDSLQNSIQKILLVYSRTLLTMHVANDLNNLTNATAEIAKTIMNEFHSTLATVQVNPTADLSGTESYLAAQQLDDDPHELKADSRTENPSESCSEEHEINLVEQLNNLKINDIDDTTVPLDVRSASVTNETSELPNAQIYCEDMADYRNTEKATASNPFEEDGKGTLRSKFEMSITNTCKTFLQRHQSNDILDRVQPEQRFGLLASNFSDTNPFKEDVMIKYSAGCSEVPPPVPPRFNQRIGDNSVETLPSIIPQDTLKLVYSAAPVMYNSSHTNTNQDSKRVDLSVEDDDTGYQSDAASPILKNSIPQQDKQVIKVSRIKSYEDAQMNNGGLVIDDRHGVNGLSKDKSFSLVQLTFTVASVFHIDGEGWIPVWEFLSIFTPYYKIPEFYKFLGPAIHPTAVLLMKRGTNSALLDHYDRTMSYWIPNYRFVERRNWLDNNEVFALIQLSSVMIILSRMHIISKEEISRQLLVPNGLPDYKASRVMVDVMTLILTYGRDYKCN